MEKTGKTVFNTLWSFEKVKTLIASITVSIFAIVAMVLSIIYILLPADKDGSPWVMGTMDGPVNCVRNNCSGKVSYVVDGSNCSPYYQSTNLQENENVKVYYDPNHVCVINKDPIINIPKYIGWLIIVGAVVLPSLAWLSYYFVNRSSAYGGVSGGLDVAGQISRMI
jgi:hypothetical protein